MATKKKAKRKLIAVLVVLAIIAAVLLKKMPIGWYILAVGGNEKSARLSGTDISSK